MNKKQPISLSARRKRAQRHADERIEIRFKALEPGAEHGYAWEHMWDIIYARILPLVMADVLENEERAAA